MKALIVDGYNAIYKIGHLQKMLDKSLYEARQALTELAMEYSRKVGGIAEVYVVFDGKDEFRRSPLSHANPHQIFSKTGEGDRTIIQMVQKVSARYQPIVVSDDNFVRNNSRAHQASTISIPEFLAAIRKNAEGKRHETSDEKKIDPKVAKDITDYLKKRLSSHSRESQ